MSKRRWIYILIEIILIIIIVNNFGLLYIQGDSMEPNISSKEILIYSKWGDCNKGDIIVFYAEAFNRLLIKRIETINLKTDEYYVLGDNLEVSEDSRNPLIGYVNKEDIKGKILIRIFPLNKFGTIGGAK